MFQGIADVYYTSGVVMRTQSPVLFETYEKCTEYVDRFAAFMLTQYEPVINSIDTYCPPIIGV